MRSSHSAFTVAFRDSTSAVREQLLCESSSKSSSSMARESIHSRARREKQHVLP